MACWGNGRLCTICDQIRTALDNFTTTDPTLPFCSTEGCFKSHLLGCAEHDECKGHGVTFCNLHFSDHCKLIFSHVEIIVGNILNYFHFFNVGSNYKPLVCPSTAEVPVAAVPRDVAVNLSFIGPGASTMVVTRREPGKMKHATVCFLLFILPYFIYL